MEHFDPCDRLLVACLGATLPVSDPPEAVREACVAVTAWGGFVRRASVQGVVGWVHEVLRATRAGLVPPEVLDELHRARLAHTARAAAMNREAASVLKTLIEAGIQFVVLKGPHLAENVYQQPNVRYFTDLDLLVREEDVSAAGRAFKAIGYHPAEEEGAVTSIFDEGKTQVHYLRSGCMPIDLHWDVINLPTHMSSFAVDMDEIWDRVVTADIFGMECMVLSPEDLLLFQCTHMTAHHDFNRLLWIKDVEQVLGRYREQMDWRTFTSRVERYRMQSFVYYALLITRGMFGKVDVPAEMMSMMRPKYLTARVFEMLLKKTNILEMQGGRRAPALEVWRVMRDDPGKRAGAIAGRLFPRVDWYLECYPFLPKIRNRNLYYGIYPLLMAMRIAKRPVDRLERQH